MSEYIPYGNCIIRTPLYPFNNIDKLDDFEFSIYQQSFKEAIYIASPVLYNELYIKKNFSHKTIKSAIKYFLRSCTRCTPYGAFAGCDIVRVDNIGKSEINMASIKEYKTFSRIDMNYLCEYIRILDSLPEIRNSISFHLNTSSYFINNSLRYIEYKLDKIRRKYFFSQVDCPACICAILKKMKKESMSINQLAALIINKTGIDYDSVISFINELIDEQVLISDLEPSVIGEDLIYQIKNKLVKINYNTDFVDQIIDLLNRCDERKFGEKVQFLDKLYNALSSSSIVKQGAFIHVDTLNKVEKGTIGNNIIVSIKKCLSFISKFQLHERIDILDAFKKRFYNRYEEQEVPLVVALDPQIGLGYGQWTDLNGDINPLLQGLPNPKSKTNEADIQFNPANTLLLRKYEEAIKLGLNNINITDADIEDFNEIKFSMPQCSVMFSVISNDDNPTILLKGVYGGVSARLLSRFEYLEQKIENHVNEINLFDNQIYNNCIVAEIAHLPEDRVGNIQMHPNNREYSICYLSNPSKEYINNIIPIDDIMISVPGGHRIVLRSKRWNKQIIPMLTTAHNSTLGLPIYSFLVDYISQDSYYFVFDWSTYFNRKPYLPRVSYQNIILKPARWVISIKQFREGLDIETLLKYKEEVHMPDEVLYCMGDHQLYINFNKQYAVDILYEELIKRKYIILEEFLFNDKNNLVRSIDGYFMNEIILNLHK